MRQINSCLNKQLRDICQRSVELDDLNIKLNQFLPISLRAHCRAGSFNKGCLTILIEEAIWATELRYCIPELRDRLRKEAGLYNLVSITTEIATELAPKPSSKAKKLPTLSTIAQKIVRDAGELCSYGPLKASLLRLANRKDKL